MKYNIKDQGRDEPKKLSSLKQILSLFKGGGLEELLLKLRGMKQDTEIGIENSKLNAMSLSPGKYNEETQSFDEYTDEDFGRVFDVLDSLGVERSKTDSLLNVLQEKNIETDSSKVVEDYFNNIMLKTKKSKAAVKAAKNLSARLKLGEGGADAILKRLKETDIQRYNTSFGPKNFFGLIEGMQKGLLQPDNPAYERGLRVLKLYKDFF